MDIYRSRSNWQFILGLIGVVILLVTIVYSNYLANKLAESEKKNISLYIEALDKITGEVLIEDLGTEDLLFYQNVLESFSLPVITEDESGRLEGNNWSEKKNLDSIFLHSQITDFEKKGGTKLNGIGYAKGIYIFNSPILEYIRYFPIVQTFLVSIFVLFAYFLFNASRRAEQNRVWAGMAKETAHQLGTPISAILGWIEHLKILSEDNPEQEEVIKELIKDVDRLELVADRFSKIGSAPALKKIDLNAEVLKCKEYMQRRSPRKVTIKPPVVNSEYPIYVMINGHLFDWVVENIIRNALDAMDGKGEITSTIKEDDDMAVLEITDTGKGIPSSKFKSVFKPGFSTKKRGWGLGLSLAKRIIESYHNGKIYVKSSKPGIGTTFTIKLPLAKS